MGTTRRGQNVMGNSQKMGGAVSLTRILAAVTAALVLGILLAASSASAKTVYPYEFAGFFDGTGSTKGQFKSELAGIDYWPTGQNLMVSVAGEPGIIAKFNKNGTPANFSALNNGAGRDYIDLGSSATGEVAIDQSSNPASAGNIYLGQLGYKSNGLEITKIGRAHV